MLRQFVIGFVTFCFLGASLAFAGAVTSDDGSVPRRGFRLYPAFLREGVVVEAAHDKGLMVDLIVRCSEGAGVITLSKVEKLYCLPDHSCTESLNTAIHELCR